MMLFPNGGLNPLLLLLGALALDLIVADLAAMFEVVPHPVALVGRAIGWFDLRLNREWRDDRTRLMRGVVTVSVLVAGAAAAGYVIADVLRDLDFGWLIELLLVAVLLAQRSLFEHVADVADALYRRGLEGGREAVSHIVGRDPHALDEAGVVRAAIESLVENFSDAVVAPVLWYALLGLPGLFVYKTVNTLDSMIGHRTPRYLHFGWAAARLDDLLNLAPARLAGMLLTAAALLTPHAHAGPALRIMLRDAGKHRSPNAGWPEAATAGALDLALAGPRRYHGETVEEPWLGDGRAAATIEDIGRALRLYAVACLLLAVGLALVYLALEGATV
jgi:adenosylcobinamide-phosphate synthase